MSDLRLTQTIRVTVDSAAFIAFALAAWASLAYPWLARALPLSVSLLASVLAGILLVKDWRKYSALRGASDKVPDSDRGSGRVTAPQVRAAAVYYIAFVAYAAAIWVVGMVAASAGFITAFLFLSGQARAPWAVLSGVGTGLAVFALIRLLSLDAPESIVALWL